MKFRSWPFCDGRKCNGRRLSRVDPFCPSLDTSATLRARCKQGRAAVTCH